MQFTQFFCCIGRSLYLESAALDAGIAQLVEQLTCNQEVEGSTPSAGTKKKSGGVPERPKGADCKSAVTDFEGSNPSPTTKFISGNGDNP